MKKVIAILLICVLFITACSSPDSNDKITSQSQIDDDIDIDIDVDVEKFHDLSDMELLAYVEDEIYAGLESQLYSENYNVESVDAIYISKEYLEELEFNSKENIFFGYTLSELDQQYEGTRYIFTLGDDGQTITKTFEKYDDTYNEVIKNVVIGTGVILICATVSMVSGGTVSMIFAASAKTGALFASSLGTISGAGAAIATGIEKNDFEEALKAGAFAGSEGFKWGAITGVIAGGIGKKLSLSKSPRNYPSPRESELYVLKHTKNGEEQVAYKNGVEVSRNIIDSTRPDVVVKNADGTVKAIEVKNYDLTSKRSRQELYSVVKKQVSDRVRNLPEGSTQEIVLDGRYRGFSKQLIKQVIAEIKEKCRFVYPDIPVTVMR